MPKIREINDRDINVITDPTRPCVAEVVDQFAESPFTIYAMYDDDTMFAAEQTPLGFIVMYDHACLVDESRPNEVVDVEVGGQPVAWNRRFILPHAQVIPAVKAFLLHHDMSASLGWLASSAEFPTYKVWRPPRSAQQ